MPKKNEGEPYYRLTLDEAAEMHGKEGVLIVDVRGPDEYSTGHVEGAMSIPVDEVLSRVGELPTDQKLLFICAAGVRSGLAAEMAAAMGLDTENLYNIEDGTPAWIERQFPTSYPANG